MGDPMVLSILFVDLVGNEIDFLRFDYEEQFMRAQCTPNLPSITSLERTPHQTRGLTPLRKAIMTPARRRNIFLCYIKQLRTLLSTCPTNRPVFQELDENSSFVVENSPSVRYLRLPRLRPVASNKVIRH